MLEVQGGWLDGSAIRKARKSFKCEYWRGASSGGRCRKPIAPGDYYVAGEGNGETGPNGVLLQDKYCVECAGHEAIATIARIGL